MENSGQIITKELVQDAIDAAYTKFVGVKEGRNADYIPYLEGIDSNLFGISVCLANGEQVSAGETTFAFGIESISKVATALLIMNQHSANEILEKIGADATGLPFNSIIAILLENDHPSTPLVNAGAICACSMVEPKGDSDAKWNAITKFFKSLSGSEVKLIDELYKSESESNFNNKSIAWLLKNFDRIYDDLDMSLDLYTRQCSLGVTTEQLAIMAATIAHSGVNPVTKEKVFKPSLTPHITSMMATVGLYEHTGDWMFTTGVPAKSGVGGGLMGVVPGVMGIAAFAPPLDLAGNSVKAQRAIAYIADRLSLNIYSPYRCTIEQHDYVYV
ncbi:MAG: glutaminase A [Rikenellaceae bacterium]